MLSADRLPANSQQMSDTEYVLVMTTLPADADASTFAQTLVDARLAACVNLMGPMESIYRWEGRVDREQERQLLIKTSRDRLTALWDRVRELHPYDVPEFLVVPIVEGNAAYLRWVGESTRDL
jgi:periplasmic divalent cation tolerance protein